MHCTTAASPQLSQLHFPTLSKDSVWDNTPSATRTTNNVAVPNLPPDVLQAGLGRASTRQLSQPPARGDWVLPRYSRRPHHPTPISVSDFRKFKNTTHKVRSCHLMVYYVIRRNAKQWSGKGEDGDRNERGVTANAITAGDVAPLCTVVDMCELWMSSQCCRIPLAVENTVCR